MPTIEDLAVALAASLPDDMLARGALSESARLLGLALRSVRAEALEEAARVADHRAFLAEQEEHVPAGKLCRSIANEIRALASTVESDAKLAGKLERGEG